MKILYIYGNSDYAYVQWEYLTEDEQAHVITILKNSESNSFEFNDGCYIELKEFNDVDEKFIEFLYESQIIDYDYSKHRNFEILEQ